MISVIIPTMNAEKDICDLLDKLNTQTRKPDEIIVVDSESSDCTVSLCEHYEDVKVIKIKRKDFDHGKTRDMAFRQSKGDFVIFMTQDAIPYDDSLIENLLKSFDDDEVSVVCGRQLPKKNATKAEQLIREFNYPSESFMRSREDIEKMGIKAFFCSDVCAAYRREAYLAVGGFDYPLKTNEDMFMAATMLHNGYKIMYCAEAKVYHSHNFSLREQYGRNYIQGYEIERHSELLQNVSATGEGIKLIKYVSTKLLKEAHLIMFVRFGFDCCARLMGSKMGKRKGRMG